jgi:hypothetical protein
MFPLFPMCSYAIFYINMEVIRSSATSVHIRTTRRQIPEDGTIHNYRCESLKAYENLEYLDFLVMHQSWKNCVEWRFCSSRYVFQYMIKNYYAYKNVVC